MHVPVFTALREPVNSVHASALETQAGAGLSGGRLICLCAKMATSPDRLVPSSMRADSNTYMKLRARSHERPMTMKCWLWCQRKVCNDDADSYSTPVVAYRPALVCRKASRLGHARTSRSPCHSSPSRPAPKRLPSPDAPQSPLFGLNRKDYSPFVPHGP